MRTTLSLIIVGVVLWFSVTNVEAITLNLLFWDVTASTALIIFISFLLGFFLGVIRLAPGLWRKHSSYRTSEDALTKTVLERDELKKEVENLKTKAEPHNPSSGSDKTN